MLPPTYTLQRLWEPIMALSVDIRVIYRTGQHSGGSASLRRQQHVELLAGGPHLSTWDSPLHRTIHPTHSEGALQVTFSGKVAQLMGSGWEPIGGLAANRESIWPSREPIQGTNRNFNPTATLL